MTNDSIIVDEREVEKLVKEFPGAEGSIRRTINSLLEHSNKKPFKEKERTFFIHEIKRSITLKNLDFKEELALKKKNKDTTQKIQTENIEPEKIIFNYPSYKPEQNIDTLEKLKTIIIENFPDIWEETKACLSCYQTLSLKNLNGCPSLVLVGNPSGEKTTVLSFFYGFDLSYLSDDFSPRAFVSHSANVKKAELEAIDLLPRIKDMVLITPELAPLFEAQKDKIIDNFATLTRVLDGEGLNSDKGTHGQRGYSGDYKFIWMGATTPLRASVWNIMGKIGNRLFFLNMRDKNRNDKNYLEMFSGKPYEEKVKICRGAIHNFLKNQFEKNKVRSVEWDNKQDLLLIPEIIKHAQLLAKLRGTLMVWRSEDKDKFEHNFPVIEEPPRAINSLYNLAKGHALIHGRNYLKKEDLEIVKRIAFSSLPHDRSEFFKLLAKHDGRLTTKNIEAELNCSDDTARRTMNIFGILGIVDVKNLDLSDNGRPMKFVEIKKEFKELLEHTQYGNNAENPLPQKINDESDKYTEIKPEDFIENK